MTCLFPVIFLTQSVTSDLLVSPQVIEMIKDMGGDFMQVNLCSCRFCVLFSSFSTFVLSSLIMCCNDGPLGRRLKHLFSDQQ